VSANALSKKKKKKKIKLRKGLVPEKKLKEVPLGGAEVPKEEFFSSRNC
jgi:hypothetical protein